MDFNLGAAMKDYKENNEILVLEPGSYTLECVAAKATKSKNGNPTIIPSFKVAAGPHAGKRVLAGNITYTENAAPFFFRDLKGFGIDENFLNQANSLDDPIKAIADALVGRVIEATLTIDEWQGEARNKLGAVRLAQTAQVQAAPPPAPVQQQAPVQQAPAPPPYQEDQATAYNQVPAPQAQAPVQAPPVYQDQQAARAPSF